jgi:hypothetical protein
MRRILFLFLLLNFIGYSQNEGTIIPNTTEKVSGAYGFKEKDPIKVGGGDMPTRVFEYMKHLKGPNGEPVTFEKLGNGASYDNPDPTLTKMEKGKVYMYEIKIHGTDKSYIIYFDQYRYEQPQILKGFTWK